MPSSTDFLSLEEVLAIHELVLPVGDGEAGVRDLGILESAIFRPQTGYYSDLPEMAAALMESLLINHAFVDGNERVALVATDTSLRLNSYRLALETEPAWRTLIAALADADTRFAAIDPWIRDSIAAL